MLKQSSFDLVSVDGPVGVGDFFSAVEFEVRAGADLFDELSDGVGLAAVDGASVQQPASARVVAEWQASTDTKQQELVADSPVVAHAHLWFDPDQARLVGEAPGSHDVEGISQERVCCPQVQVCTVRGQRGNWFFTNSFDRHCGIMIRCRPAR